MQRDDNGPLLEVAKAVCDGSHVDWDKESAANEQLRRKLDRLRVLEAVAAAHRAPDITDEAKASTDPGVIGIALSAASTQPAPSPSSAQLPAQWGPLRIVEKLGQGGFGEVYRAYDPTLQREVALKLRRPDKQGAGHGSGRFVDEARRLARVRHPNVLVVHGADMHEGRVGLWTDLLEGKTLEQCLLEQGPFGAHEAALVGIDLCRALAAVHAAGLIHRDVKTSNVMREKGGRIVLMDFGSVSEIAEADGAGDNGKISGTPLAMAPEVLLRGEAPRPSADIYALGVLLYRLVSGRFPIEAANLSELRDKLSRGDSVALRDARPDLPTAFVQAVETALDVDPQRRFASAGAMERAMVAAIGSPASLREPSLVPHPLWKRPWIWASGVATAVLTAFLLAHLPGGTYSVEMSLFRQAGGADERLMDGARIGAGDKLFVELMGSKELYVYILDEDRRGEVFVLFPAGLDVNNPLPPDILHRLPGSLEGEQQFWQVTSAGGRESIFLIASLRPLPDLEREIAKLPVAEAGRPVIETRLDTQAMDRITRGIGGMAGAGSGAADPSAGGLGRLAKILPQQRESASDIWIRRVELENPGQ